MTTHQAGVSVPSRALAARDGAAETPDVVGSEVLDAHRQLRSEGLRMAVSMWETKIGPWGMVLSQQPARGTPLRRGATVHVVIAGRPRLSIPDVRGLEAGSAMVILRRAGLLPLLAEERASRLLPAGHVVATRPRAGTLVFDGDRVGVIMARAPARRSSRPARDGTDR